MLYPSTSKQYYHPIQNQSTHKILTIIEITSMWMRMKVNKILQLYINAIQLYRKNWEKH